MAEAKVPTVAIGCQGGGMHAAFEVGVLGKILDEVAQPNPRFKLVGLSGTSAGALCALMTWYGLAPKKSGSGSPAEAKRLLNRFWEHFVARTRSESLLNCLTSGAFKAEESEIPFLGLSPGPALGINPSGAIYKAVAACLPQLGVRREYFDLVHVLKTACPEFEDIAWANVDVRLLIGASEVVGGCEAVFDSDLKKPARPAEKIYEEPKKPKEWRQRLPLCLEGVAASGTLPAVREAEHINGCFYWDGLYSLNPPVREFVEDRRDAPDELWILRINPQEWPHLPTTHGDIEDRENELMGNLSLHKDLDFIMKVNGWRDEIKKFAETIRQYAPKIDSVESIPSKTFESTLIEFLEERIPDLYYKKVVVRTIKMRRKTCDELRFSSKFDRSFDLMDRLRQEGAEVAGEWLAEWPKCGTYPNDAGYGDR